MLKIINYKTLRVNSTYLPVSGKKEKKRATNRFGDWDVQGSTKSSRVLEVAIIPCAWQS